MLRLATVLMPNDLAVFDIEWEIGSLVCQGFPLTGADSCRIWQNMVFHHCILDRS